ncbi:MAG: hypothetical protein HY077_13210 [Elusimicrobia bacterium]|nr:hypothetical protein [Elusimicrobiota bacterium]
MAERRRLLELVTGRRTFKPKLGVKYTMPTFVAQSSRSDLPTFPDTFTFSAASRRMRRKICAQMTIQDMAACGTLHAHSFEPATPQNHFGKIYSRKYHRANAYNPECLKLKRLPFLRHGLENADEG